VGREQQASTLGYDGVIAKDSVHGGTVSLTRNNFLTLAMVKQPAHHQFSLHAAGLLR